MYIHFVFLYFYKKMKKITFTIYLCALNVLYMYICDLAQNYIYHYTLNF